MLGPVNKYEHEIKVMLPDCKLLDYIERRIVEELGGIFERRVLEKDLYFQHPCRDFASTNEALRVREYSNGVVELTYKGPRRETSSLLKSREEVSVIVMGGNILLLLERLGFRRVIVIEKFRRYFRLGDGLVTLDEVKGLGCFIEIEYKGSGDPSSEINRLVTLLGLQNYPRTTLSYLELIMAQGLEGTRIRG